MKTLTIEWLNKCRCGNKLHTVKTARGNESALWDDDAVKCDSCGRGGVIQVCEGQARVLWETDEEMAEGKRMSTITKERLQWLANISGRDDIEDIDGGEIRELARIALASFKAKPVAFINGAREPVLYGEHIGIAIATQLYTAPPAQMLEIENLEHFISFWKKVQAGQMKPGKNDIDHMVWFLEGLSNLTAPPAPVVPEEATPENIAILASTFAPRGVTYQWDSDECNAAADSWNACRDAMLQGAEHVTTAYKLPEGWVAVPVNATRAMIDAAARVEEDGYDAMRKAMIAAAPQQEVKP